MNKYYLAQVDIIAGLRTEKPVCISKVSCFSKNVMYKKDSYLSVNITKPKLYSDGGQIKFYSKDKKDVENFILGVKAANTIISELTKNKLNA